MSRLAIQIVRFTLVGTVFACLSAASLASQAHTGVPWHGTLEQAKAASAVSKRPILAVFGATWSEASVTLHEKTLANPEAAAIVTACFEPVKIDVDVDPATTKRMGVTYLPSACVIGLDDRVLASFDCPDTAASFVAAVGRAAQDAALASREAAPSVTASTSTAAPTTAATATPARTRSAFSAASQSAAPPATAPQPEPGAPSMAPQMPPAPWSTPFAPPATAAATPRQVLDPAPPPPPAGPAGTTPWLGDTARPASPPPASGTASATAALPPTPPAQPTAPEKPKATNSFIAALQKPFSIFSKQPKSDAGEKPAPAPVPAAGAADPYGTMPLGMEGYCPVTLVEKGTWVEGRAQWGARHRGRTYLFAGEPQQRAFLADPDRYAPALSGDDPVMAFDSGKTVPGQRRYGVTYQARIYLFSSPETRTMFSADPQRYTTRVAMAENRGPSSGSVLR